MERGYEQCICEKTDRDRGRAHEHVGCEAHPAGPSPMAILGEVHAADDPDRYADQRREAHHDRGSRERMCHAGAFDADRPLDIGEELGVNYGGEPLADRVVENQAQWDERKPGERIDHAQRQGVLVAPPEGPGHNVTRLAVDRTSSSAMMLIVNVTRISTRPSSRR